MEAIFSSMRWPPALYRAIKAEASKAGVSVNAYVCEHMSRVMDVKEDGHKDEKGR